MQAPARLRATLARSPPGRGSRRHEIAQLLDPGLVRSLDRIEIRAERGYSSALRPDATSSSLDPAEPAAAKTTGSTSSHQRDAIRLIPVGSIQPNDTSIRIPHGP